jgi:NADPH:quinone reductase-like Zn-dependent oxidoreductase
MRALVLNTLNTSPVVADIPVPEPEPGEVLIRVTASSVNPHDAMVASGAATRYMTYELPAVLGSDVSGTVEKAGYDVSDVVAGDRVFGLLRELIVRRGTFAEYVVIPRDWICLTPAGVDDDFAGTLGLAALTALRCLEAVAPSTGDVVLINGATGGVGSYLTQMLSSRGVHVIATAHGDAGQRHAESMGALHVVDWVGGDLSEAVTAVHPQGIQAMVDLVNRDPAALTELASKVLTPHGRVVSTGHAANPEALPGRTAVNVVAVVDRSAMAEIGGLAADGVLRSAVTRSFGLHDVANAFDALQDGAVGKIAISVVD